MGAPPDRGPPLLEQPLLMEKLSVLGASSSLRQATAHLSLRESPIQDLNQVQATSTLKRNGILATTTQEGQTRTQERKSVIKQLSDLPFGLFEDVSTQMRGCGSLRDAETTETTSYCAQFNFSGDDTVGLVNIVLSMCI